MISCTELVIYVSVLACEKVTNCRHISIFVPIVNITAPL